MSEPTTPAYKLSYLLTTYNKLPYLQHVLERLIAARQPDEEIVIADGGSTDGTVEYLNKLFAAGQIQQLVSERDKGEAHGFNKCSLMARGEILKYITDDDAFCYSAIRRAAALMQANPDIDVLTGNTGLLQLENMSHLSIYEDVVNNFKRWLHHNESVWFIGLPLMIRRSSLAFTGLFNAGVVQVDTEFSYRITSLNVSIAWSSDVLSVRIENPQSNFRVMGKQASQDESDRMRYYYDKRIGHGFMDFMRHKSGLSEALKKPVRPLKKALFNLLQLPQYEGHAQLPTAYTPQPAEEPLAAAFRVADEFMNQYNATHPTEFLYKEKVELTKVMKPS